MVRVEASVVVAVPADVAFAVSQTQGATRYRWDPFIKEQRLLNGERPAKGVQTFTRSRHRLTMVSEYVSFRPPHQVGIRMIRGPWFFDTFGGGWSFAPVEGDPSSTRATWRYSFSTRPRWLRPIAEPLGRFVLGREIRRRIDCYAAGCADPVVLAAVSAPAE